MRIATVRDLGLFVRDRRRQRGLTQQGLAETAGVSRRWLLDLEAGKPGAQIGLVLQTLDALDLALDLRPLGVGDIFDLDEVLRGFRI